MTSYLDASCLLRRLIGDGPLLEPPDLWDSAIVSEIARVEVGRTLARVERERRLTGHRLRITLEGWEALQETLEWAPVTRPVLARAAGPLPAVVKALDAIHLATALALRDSGPLDLVFATHDRQLAAAAAQFGFEVAGV